MALTPGTRRREVDFNTVSLQVRIGPDTRDRLRAMATASGLALGLFLEELVEVIELDRHGRPVSLPVTTHPHDEELPYADAG